MSGPFICDDHAYWSMEQPCLECEANDAAAFPVADRSAAEALAERCPPCVRGDHRGCLNRLMCRCPEHEVVADRSAAEALSTVADDVATALLAADSGCDIDAADLGVRLRAALDRERAAALPTLEVERLRAGLAWFIENAPVSWDEDDKGCRYCGAFERTPKDHRAGCEYVAACAAIAQEGSPDDK